MAALAEIFDGQETTGLVTQDKSKSLAEQLAEIDSAAPMLLNPLRVAKKLVDDDSKNYDLPTEEEVKREEDKNDYSLPTED